MTAPLRLTLTLDTYPEGDRWTWTLHAGRHIVSSSGGQLFSRRIDCASGAEVGAGLDGVRAAIAGKASRTGECGVAFRPEVAPGVGANRVDVAICDERGRA